MNTLRMIFLFLFVSTLASAVSIDSERADPEVSLLGKALYYRDKGSLDIGQIMGGTYLKPYYNSTVNIGISKDNIWIAFDLYNSSGKDIEKLLVITSPILETIELYDENGALLGRKGMRYIDKEHKTLYPAFPVTVHPGQPQRYYIRISSLYGPVDFAVKLKDEQDYIDEDRHTQITISLLVGVVVAFMIYSVVIFIYSYDKSYLYYSLYLLSLLYQQTAYLGLTQLYFPAWFVKEIEVYAPITKVGMMIITAAFFAMHFLKIYQQPRLYRIYKGFIYLAFVQVLVMNNAWLYDLNYIVGTGMVLIFFNQWAAFKSYWHGNKQARLFIAGFATVFISYLMMISDALGWSSYMQDYLNIMMWGTALEATILTLAFTDRYALLQAEKTRSDKELIRRSKDSERIIREEVERKTAQLATTLETKDLLIQEVHHRVKNNLQIILSLIRLQSNGISDGLVLGQMLDLENRINAIAKTYDKLIIKDNLENIDMKSYIDELIRDISRCVGSNTKNISITTDIDAMIRLRESVYVGLVVNEIITNAYKYAFGEKEGHIKLTLRQYGSHFTLIIEDDGKGFDASKKSKSLGIRLIDTIVLDQLEGTIEKNTVGKSYYRIQFKIHD